MGLRSAANAEDTEKEIGYSPSGETWNVIEIDDKYYRQRLREYEAPIGKGKKIEQNDMAAFTTLRKMAMSSQDHRTEHKAFVGEMRCKAALSSALFYPAASYAYDLLTEYGWSYLRPLAVWVLLLIGMAVYYQSAAMPLVAQAERPAICHESSDISHALLLSTHNALIFATGTQRASINRAYLCLYGDEDAKSLNDVTLPAYMGLFGALHTLLSAILIFFILLGLRNRFRIK